MDSSFFPARSPSAASSQYFNALDHFPQQQPFFSPAAPSPGLTSSLDPLPSVRNVPSGAYPKLERRQRDVSSSADLLSTHDPIASASTPAQGTTNAPYRQVGTIGDGRKLTASPSPDKAAFDARAFTSSGRDEPLVGVTRNGEGGTGGTTPSGSRPSSFILDLLPPRTSGSTTPSNAAPVPTSSTTSTSNTSAPASVSDDATSQSLSLPDSFNQSSLFHSPTSFTAPTLSLSSAEPPSSLDARISSLETSVADLFALVQTELKGQREQIALLRSLVLQNAGGGGPVVGNASAIEASPLLTLRSPSPHHSPASLPTPTQPRQIREQHSLSYLHLPSAQPFAPSSQPPSPALSAPGGLENFQNTTCSDADNRSRSTSGESLAAEQHAREKDEQLKALTAQVNSLSSSLSHLLSIQGNPSPAPSPSLPSSHHLQPNPHRQMSLPLGPTSPNLGGGQPQMAGLGVGLGGPPRSPLMRPHSANGGPGLGLSRAASIGSTYGRNNGDRSPAGFGGRSDTFESSNWGDSNIMPNSPLVGSQNGGSSNPPGSLGGKWENLGVGSELFRTIAKYGLGPPTKIQCKAIPCVLRFQDIVSQAPSIQERIQSYIVPAIQMILSLIAQAAAEGNSPNNKGVQIIVVTATVDQAAQAQRLSVGLGGSLGIRTSLCVGSGDLQADLATFVKSPPHILVGTPQRLLDLLSLRTLNVSEVRMLVVDECDQLIARNLSDYVVGINRLLPPSSPGGFSANPPSPSLVRSPLPGAFDSTPRFQDSPRFPSPAGGVSTSGLNGGGLGERERQTVIFSCTVPQDVLNFASSLQLREPVRVLVRREGGESSSPSVRGLKAYYLYIALGSTVGAGKGALGRREESNAREWKLEALADLIVDYAFETCVVFCSSVDAVEAVSYKLSSRGVEALALHQDMGPPARHQIMSKFRAPPATRPLGPTKRALIVYDALCRTLTDVSQVPLVINYDLPRAVEDYIHRVSCATAAGMGRPGVVINFVTPGSDVERLRAIESFYRIKIQELPPSLG
ncbi:eukaryotic translation initiation factor [Pseudohyphozyma bogoriensis]|nr:eukaryotic translation initiation factor [Pseudohyphozyma bogoriensis]